LGATQIEPSKVEDVSPIENSLVPDKRENEQPAIMEIPVTTEGLNQHFDTDAFLNHPFNQDLVLSSSQSPVQPDAVPFDHSQQFQHYEPENLVEGEFQKLEQQCQYYSDMYQQISENYTLVVDELNYHKENLSNLKQEFSLLNAKNDNLMETCASREKDVQFLNEKIHSLEVSKAEALHHKEEEITLLRERKIPTVNEDVDLEEIIRSRMKTALMDIDSQTVQIKERKQWCRNEEDRLQEWEDNLKNEKNRLMELEVVLQNKSDQISKREAECDSLSKQLKDHHEKLQQGQEWVRMEEEELAEKQKKDTIYFQNCQSELKAKELALFEREEKVQSFQAELDHQYSEFVHERSNLEMQKQEFEVYMSSQTQHNSLHLNDMDPVATFDSSVVPMPSEEVKQWIDYYNTKCAELDLTQQELVVEKEGYQQLSAQLQEQLQNNSHNNLLAERFSVNEMVPGMDEEREIALQKKEYELQERINSFEATRQSILPNAQIDIKGLENTLQQLKTAVEQKEHFRPQFPELQSLQDRMVNIESINQQLMAYLSNINQKIETFRPATPSTDFCTAITELSRYVY
jgi:hypothetical protein